MRLERQTSALEQARAVVGDRSVGVGAAGHIAEGVALITEPGAIPAAPWRAPKPRRWSIVVVRTTTMEHCRGSAGPAE